MEWVESIGDSVEFAKEQALDRLGVAEDDAEFEVLNDVKTGMFGRIKEPARVRARVRPRTPRSKEESGRRDRGNGRGRQSKHNRNRSNRNSQEPKRSERTQTASNPTPSAPSESDQKSGKKAKTSRTQKKKVDNVNENQEMMPLVDQADLAEGFVGGLAERFGASVQFEREHIGSEEIRITVSGDQIGRMVGHRGATASAIDDLVRTFLQRRAGSARNGRIRVDIGGVIAKRNASLHRFAREQAKAVQESGVSRSLEPMNANDRKVVHDAIDGTEGVRTISEGEEPRRYVVIIAVGS